MQMLNETYNWEEVFSQGNSLRVIETASMGFDPSTGRTPVEQTNNYSTGALAITTNLVIKAAPGFLHKIILRAGQAADFEIHDHATGNSALMFKSGAITAPAVPVVIEVNALMTAGIVLRNTHGSIAHAAGDVVIIYR